MKEQILAFWVFPSPSLNYTPQKEAPNNIPCTKNGPIWEISWVFLLYLVSKVALNLAHQAFVEYPHLGFTRGPPSRHFFLFFFFYVISKILKQTRAFKGSIFQKTMHTKHTRIEK
jgi:hypothetical protein